MDPESFMKEFNKGTVYLAVEEIEDICRSIMSVSDDFEVSVSYNGDYYGKHCHGIEFDIYSDTKILDLICALRRIQVRYNSSEEAIPQAFPGARRVKLIGNFRINLEGVLGHRIISWRVKGGVITVK